MSNIYDYLKWRGDLSMRIDPFNDIDGLILSELVYVDFDKIVPTFPNEQSYCLKDVANNFTWVKLLATSFKQWTKLLFKRCC